MANPHKSEVEVTAAGKSYTLVFSNNALCELEDKLGRGFPDIAMEMQSWSPPLGADKKPVPETDDQLQARVRKMRLSLMRALLWAALRKHHPEITLEQAGDLMTEIGGLVPTMDHISKALVLGFPDSEARPQTPDSRAAA